MPKADRKNTPAVAAIAAFAVSVAVSVGAIFLLILFSGNSEAVTANAYLLLYVPLAACLAAVVAAILAYRAKTDYEVKVISISTGALIPFLCFAVAMVYFSTQDAQRQAAASERLTAQSNNAVENARAAGLPIYPRADIYEFGLKTDDRFITVRDWYRAKASWPEIRFGKITWFVQPNVKDPRVIVLQDWKTWTQISFSKASDSAFIEMLESGLRAALEDRDDSLLQSVTTPVCGQNLQIKGGADGLRKRLGVEDFNLSGGGNAEIHDGLAVSTPLIGAEKATSKGARGISVKLHFVKQDSLWKIDQIDGPL